MNKQLSFEQIHESLINWKKEFGNHPYWIVNQYFWINYLILKNFDRYLELSNELTAEQ